jgi:hypothetical protein
MSTPTITPSNPGVDPSTQPQSGVMNEQAGVPGGLAQLLLLRSLGMGGGSGMPSVGNTSTGPALPQQPASQYPMHQVSQMGPAQGEFQSKGAHQRASMAALASSVQGAAATITNKINEQKNRQMQNAFGTFITAQKGISQGQEMVQNAQSILKQDPNNAQAQQMLQSGQQMIQQNNGIMSSLLQDKKNHKLLEKGFGVNDSNADTPERAAAIAAMKKSNPGMSPQTAQFMSQVPQTLQVSPMTQLQGQMVQQGVLPKPATGSAMLSASEKEKATAEKAREFDVKNLNDTNKTDVQAAAHGLKPNPNGQGYMPMTPEDLKKYPLLQEKLEMDKSSEALKAAQQALAQAKAIGEPQRIAQASANLGLRQQELGIKQADLELRMRDETRKDRVENFKEGYDSAGNPTKSMEALSPAAQKVVMDTQPVLDQVNDLSKRLDPYKDINTPGYLAADRTLYAMGMKSNVTGQLADEVANLELQRIVAAASVMKGSSRTIQALRIAMQHTPNVWTDSPALIKSKLDTIQARLSDVIGDAYTYGHKGGYAPPPNLTGGTGGAPKPASGAPPAPSGGGKVLNYNPKTGQLE